MFIAGELTRKQFREQTCNIACLLAEENYWMLVAINIWLLTEPLLLNRF